MDSIVESTWLGGLVQGTPELATGLQISSAELQDLIMITIQGGAPANSRLPIQCQTASNWRAASPSKGTASSALSRSLV